MYKKAYNKARHDLQSLHKGMGRALDKEQQALSRAAKLAKQQHALARKRGEEAKKTFTKEFNEHGDDMHMPPVARTVTGPVPKWLPDITKPALADWRKKEAAELRAATRLVINKNPKVKSHTLTYSETVKHVVTEKHKKKKKGWADARSAIGAPKHWVSRWHKLYG